MSPDWETLPGNVCGHHLLCNTLIAHILSFPVSFPIPSSLHQLWFLLLWQNNQWKLFRDRRVYWIRGPSWWGSPGGGELESACHILSGISKQRGLDTDTHLGFFFTIRSLTPAHGMVPSTFRINTPRGDVFLWWFEMPTSWQWGLTIMLPFPPSLPIFSLCLLFSFVLSILFLLCSLSFHLFLLILLPSLPPLRKLLKGSILVHLVCYDLSAAYVQSFFLSNEWLLCSSNFGWM